MLASVLRWLDGFFGNSKHDLILDTVKSHRKSDRKAAGSAARTA
jgi:hypothetical protein